MNLTSETEIDLREVCAKYRTRFNIRTPWVFGGREYYTDGMRLVWRAGGAIVMPLISDVN